MPIPTQFIMRPALMVLSALLLISCATAVPEIYLRQSDLRMELKAETYGMESLAVSKDGKYLLTSDNGGQWLGKSSIRLWDITEWRQILKLDTPDTIFSIALSPDHRYAIAGSHEVQPTPLDKVFGIEEQEGVPLKAWDLSTGRLHKKFERFEAFRGHEFNSVNYSRDGKYFLACDWAGTHIFDAQTFTLLKSLIPREVRSPALELFAPPYRSFVAAFSPDNRYVLSGGPDAVLHLWELASGRELHQFYGHQAGMMYGGI
ncbi:MAG TPA: hypothetical protein VLH39_05335, partial [Magnetospirillaceae bacterium]|nr:hypothetical protein [Magnetospirillaceae bacterium]